MKSTCSEAFWYLSTLSGGWLRTDIKCSVLAKYRCQSKALEQCHQQQHYLVLSSFKLTTKYCKALEYVLIAKMEGKLLSNKYDSSETSLTAKTRRSLISSHIFFPIFSSFRRCKPANQLHWLNSTLCRCVHSQNAIWSAFHCWFFSLMPNFSFALF